MQDGHNSAIYGVVTMQWVHSIIVFFTHLSYQSAIWWFCMHKFYSSQQSACPLAQ